MFLHLLQKGRILWFVFAVTVWSYDIQTDLYRNKIKIVLDTSQDMGVSTSQEIQIKKHKWGTHLVFAHTTSSSHFTPVNNSEILLKRMLVCRTKF